MKILFFSDIHGKIDNLKYIEELERQNNFDRIVVLGDLCSYYSYQDSIDVVEFLNKYLNKLIITRGNCDSDFVMKLINVSTPDIVELNVDNLKLYLTHGHLCSYSKNYKYHNGILIYGHEHIPYIKKENNMIYICVGSISLPRGNSKPSYLIYENYKFTLYDIEKNIIDRIEV